MWVVAKQDVLRGVNQDVQDVVQVARPDVDHRVLVLVKVIVAARVLESVVHHVREVVVVHVPGNVNQLVALAPNSMIK